MDGLMRCWRKVARHLASCIVCTFLRTKSQRNANLFLKISTMSFRIRSVFYLDVFLKSTSPSSLYKPVNCLSSLFDNKGNKL